MFKVSSRIFYYQRPFGDPLENDMSDRRPTCLIGDPSDTDMTDWRPTYLIGYRHAWSETHQFPTCLIKHVGFRTVMLIKLQWVSNQTCRYPMGLHLVSNSNNIFGNWDCSPYTAIWWIFRTSFYLFNV